MQGWWPRKPASSEAAARTTLRTGQALYSNSRAIFLTVISKTSLSLCQRGMLTQPMPWLGRSTERSPSQVPAQSRPVSSEPSLEESLPPGLDSSPVTEFLAARGPEPVIFARERMAVMCPGLSERVLGTRSGAQPPEQGGLFLHPSAPKPLPPGGWRSAPPPAPGTDGRKEMPRQGQGGATQPPAAAAPAKLPTETRKEPLPHPWHCPSESHSPLMPWCLASCCHGNQDGADVPTGSPGAAATCIT